MHMCGRPDHESNLLVSIRSRILSALQIRDVNRLTQIYIEKKLNHKSLRILMMC